jgi:serine/threonine-protein kinase
MPASPTPDVEFLALQEALVGRYSIERELGRGGMGVVYLAQDVALDRPVALKLLPAALAARPTLRERFLREARTAAKLSHPNIVPIHAVEELGEFVFFVMSFVEGQTLGQRVRERGPVDPREATRILREVAWALAYAHAQGVVHRDIKPDNILIEAGGGRAMVTDFGIARAGTAAGPTNVGEIMGTPEYMSPEQAGGQVVDGRSDLYALGVVGYYMVSGVLPFQGPTPQATLAKQLTQAAPAVASVAPEVPGELAGALDRCLQKDPAARIQDGGELADVLGRVLRDRREVPVAIRVFQEQNRESTGAMAVMSMLLVMMVTIVFLVVGEGGEPLSDMVPGLIMMGLLSLLPPTLLGVIARRLLKAGHGHDELVRALRQDVEDRRREVASQAGEDTAVDVWAPRVGWLGTLLFGTGMLGIPLPWVPIPLIEALLVAGMPLALLGGGTAAIRGAVRKAVPGARWLPFWDSFIGKGIFTAAGLGLERGAAAGGAYRPTELAIGMAAERLFEELPKDVRKSLRDIPAVLRQLEGHAERMRARVEDLDRVVADAGTDPVAREVRRTRDAAKERLRQVVAALERLRLELLRLHAGSGDVQNMTMDLAAARALAEDIGYRAEGQREVDEALGLPSGLPDPADTPQPA